jgi:hypothetical protein
MNQKQNVILFYETLLLKRMTEYLWNIIIFNQLNKFRYRLLLHIISTFVNIVIMINLIL